MKVFITVFLIFNAITLNAQKTTLRVLGQSNYIEYANSNGIIISFNKNEADKISKFSDTIFSIGISEKLQQIENTKLPLKKRYRIEVSHFKVFDKLLTLCNDLKIKIEKVYYKIPPHDYKSEDKNAILALKNATFQAKIITHNLKYKIIKILNIDDETTYSSSLYDNIDSENGELWLEFLQLLGSENSLRKVESRTPSRNGGYNIWVTYQVEKL